MSIVIGCDSFLALRNLRTGLLDRWLNGEEIHVWVDPRQLAGSQRVKPEGVELACLEEFDVRKDSRLMKQVLAAYHARKCYYDPATIWADFLLSSHRHNQRKPLRRAASVSRAAGRLGLYWLAGSLGMARHWRSAFAQALRRHPVVDVYRERLQKVDATVVVGLSPEGLREMALMEAANSLGLSTMVVIRSRDNLAAKILHLPHADAYAVWSENTRQCLLSMYPETPPERVHVTGALQFDHHVDPSLRMDRKAFFKLMGLDSKRPLIVYSMSTPGLVPHEIEIAQHLADAAHTGSFVRGAQLLVRGHPRMFGSDVKLLHTEYQEARSYPPPTGAKYGASDHESDVVGNIIREERMHLSVLAYQDVQVNICGTMTIDSAIFDKPTVNVYYDLVEGIPSGLSVSMFYERSDVQEMMSYGTSRLAHSPEECITLINQYLDNPSLDAEGRARARNKDCGPLDGLAGLRTAQIIELLSRRDLAVAS